MVLTAATMKKILLILSCSFCLLFVAPRVSAVVMENNSYKIDIERVTKSPIQSPTQQPTIIVEKKQKKAILSPSSAGIATSTLLLDYGELSGTNPVTRKHSIEVQTDHSAEVTLYAFENNELISKSSKVIIPDTTCDDGLCSEEKESLWTSTLVYGLGFRCDLQKEHGCGKRFRDERSFQQLANLSLKESAYPLFATSTSETLFITYKVNVPSTHTLQDYSHEITFLVVPKY